ncbi:hypothetical protein [Bacillus pseudomycoides]|uniref:hypothetical protein n=1 Tax=Bacillus pseudomycoides TaxID=64104 RepID=UPI0023DAECEE|nr:hypothetical protein [Bacillus pseudomycoides]MDF2083911.1 hypothetical protein [Bacillus pseudomycoides]
MIQKRVLKKEEIINLIQNLYATNNMQQLTDKISNFININLAKYKIKLAQEYKTKSKEKMTILILSYHNESIEIIFLKEKTKQIIIATILNGQKIMIA